MGSRGLGLLRGLGFLVQGLGFRASEGLGFLFQGLVLRVLRALALLGLGFFWGLGRGAV